MQPTKHSYFFFSPPPFPFPSAFPCPPSPFFIQKEESANLLRPLPPPPHPPPGYYGLTPPPPPPPPPVWPPVPFPPLFFPFQDFFLPSSLFSSPLEHRGGSYTGEANATVTSEVIPFFLFLLPVLPSFSPPLLPS